MHQGGAKHALESYIDRSNVPLDKMNAEAAPCGIGSTLLYCCGPGRHTGGMQMGQTFAIAALRSKF